MPRVNIDPSRTATLTTSLQAVELGAAASGMPTDPDEGAAALDDELADEGHDY